MSESTIINFVVDSFASELTAGVAGVIEAGVPPPGITADATAVYYVSVDDMKTAFKFQTDSLDIDNLPESELKFAVSWPSALKLNPSHAYVLENAIATEGISDVRRLVKHDFIRHIAQSLFNTHLAVDLFTNEQEMKDDLAAQGHAAWTAIETMLLSV